MDGKNTDVNEYKKVSISFFIQSFDFFLSSDSFNLNIKIVRKNITSHCLSEARLVPMQTLRLSNFLDLPSSGGPRTKCIQFNTIDPYTLLIASSSRRSKTFATLLRLSRVARVAPTVIESGPRVHGRLYGR